MQTETLEQRATDRSLRLLRHGAAWRIVALALITILGALMPGCAAVGPNYARPKDASEHIKEAGPWKEACPRIYCPWRLVGDIRRSCPDRFGTSGPEDQPRPPGCGRESAAAQPLRGFPGHSCIRN